MTTPMKVVPRAGELDRDNDGFPEGLRNTTEPRPPVNVSTINAGAQPVTAKVDQSNSGNVNHHLPWLMVAAILGAIGTTLGIVTLVLALTVGPKYLEALAEAKSSKAIALAELARKEASTAKDVVDVEKSKVQAYQDLTKELKNGRR